MVHFFRDRDTNVYAFTVDWRGLNLPRHDDTRWWHVEVLEPLEDAWSERHFGYVLRTLRTQGWFAFHGHVIPHEDFGLIQTREMF
jgi:hypothetical protein